jgi:fibronectin type 3 domain-containing protein
MSPCRFARLEQLLSFLITLAFAGVPAAIAQGGIPPGWHATPPVIAVPIGAAPAVEPFGTLSPPFNPSAVTGAYGVNALSSLPNPTGAGVTIAIIDAYGDTDGTLTDHIQGDLQTFSSNYNLPYNGPATAQPTLTEVFPDGTPTSTDSSWALETALDVEWVHAIAPAAKIILVVATDTGGSLYNGVGYAIQHAPIVSMSWGGPEFSTEDQQDTTYFSAAGVTYFASTGDNGAGTEYPSVSPNVTAIGGTSITIGSGNTWGSETGWSGSGGGTSTYEGYVSFQSPWISSGNREVPDVAAIADPNTGVDVVKNGSTYQVGGTSLAAPVWAAFTGIIDANILSPLSESTLQSLLYNYGNSTNLPSYFHDITSGSNGLNARTGYDEVTGIGTPQINALIPAIVPVPPTSVSASGTNQQITVSWSAVSNATSYNLYRGTSPGGESATPIKTGLTGTTVADTGLTNGTTYYYKVAAVTPYCTSLLSTETSATPKLASAASFVKTDSSTLGSWKGVYGGDGFDVIADLSGNNPTNPSYASFTPSGNGLHTWAASSILAPAIQKAAAGSPDRIAGCWYNASSITLDLNVTGSAHQVALYLLDWDHNNRAETITISDAATNTVLDTRSASNFGNGVYEVWNISGHVKITVARTAGSNCVLSGIFFGPGAGSSAPAAPSTASASTGTRKITLSWAVSSGATSYNVYRGTVAGAESTTPIATGQAGTTYSDTGVTGGVTYYYKVTAVNAAGGSPGSMEASALASLTNAVFVKSDAATQGSWKGAYGADGFNVINDSSVDNPSYPNYASVSASDNRPYMWASSSAASYALQKASAGSTDRIGACWYSATSFSIDVNVSDSKTHQVALYLLDWLNNGRAETITVTDPATNTVLDSRSASSFANGVYYVWNVAGHVRITFTRSAGANAVISGIFFGGAAPTITPGAPSGLSAIAARQQVSLSWNATGIATSYNIYRGTTSNGESGTPIRTGVTGSTFTDTGLSSGTTYYYKVTAVDAIGESGASNEASAATASGFASFVKTDTSTRGTWKSVYGLDGFDMVADPSANNPTNPSYATASMSGNSTYTWASSTSSTSALQKAAVGSTDRIAACWYSTTSFSIDLNVTGGAHQVGLYLLDWDHNGRVETITITDAATNTVLDSRSAGNFANGVYDIWNISGHVKITITKTSGSNAVTSGIFFR